MMGPTPPLCSFLCTSQAPRLACPNGSFTFSLEDSWAVSWPATPGAHFPLSRSILHVSDLSQDGIPLAWRSQSGGCVALHTVQ